MSKRWLCAFKYSYRIKNQARKIGEKYKGVGEYPWAGYADDLTLVVGTAANLQLAANILADLLSRFGLVLSLDKTKSMILYYQGDEYPDNIITIKQQKIKNVKKFKYLGAMLSYNQPGTSNAEISHRIGMANAKFASMKKLLCNYHLKLSTRVRFYAVYVRSRLHYCCQTWTLTNNNSSK